MSGCCALMPRYCCIIGVCASAVMLCAIVWTSSARTPRGSPMGYVDTQLFINGKWQEPAEGKTLPVVNPATDKEIGHVAHAGRPDLDRALEAAQKGFEV